MLPFAIGVQEKFRKRSSLFCWWSVCKWFVWLASRRVMRFAKLYHRKFIWSKVRNRKSVMHFAQKEESKIISILNLQRNTMNWAACNALVMAKYKWTNVRVCATAKCSRPLSRRPDSWRNAIAVAKAICTSASSRYRIATIPMAADWWHKKWLRWTYDWRSPPNVVASSVATFHDNFAHRRWVCAHPTSQHHIQVVALQIHPFAMVSVVS